MLNLLKNNKWTIFGFCMVVLCAFAGDASASNSSSYTVSELEKTALKKATDTFTAARNVMFVIGGFGLIAVSFAAIAGKMPWKWVGSLAIGLGVIAAASAVINYAITDKGTSTTVNYGDTLK